MTETTVSSAAVTMPPDWAADVVLRDGSTVCLRRLCDADRHAIETLVAGLSDQSRYFRLLQCTKGSDRMLDACLASDYPRTLSLVAKRGGEVLGVATWVRSDDSAQQAEVGFIVAEDFHGHGLGTRMLERLAELARPLGIARFEAWVHAANHEMLAVFQNSGFRFALFDMDADVSRLVLDIGETDAFADCAAVRAGAAATASLRPFFHPRVISVVGASRTRGKIGAEVFHAIRAGGFTGRVVPVNPATDRVDGVATVARVTDMTDDVDLAVVAVPAGQVEGVVDDCIAKGVRAIVVVSAGFGESGAEGQAREARIVEKVRAAGIRMIGPNCMGLIETDPAVSLNASFAPSMPSPGTVAFLSQSGALGLAILEYARRLDIGISTFVSVGNKADVSSNDLLQYWADDPRTSVVLLYLESFGNPRKFSRIAQRVARRKPVVAVKAGRSGAGARAASSHTGALATDDRVVDALFEQAGVIRTSTLEELFDVASLLAHQPLPRGHRVAILTNAGGPGILAADACEAGGLEVVRLGNASATALAVAVPGAASVANPVDLLASASPQDYRRALSLLLADPTVDAVLALYVPVLSDRGPEVASALMDAAREAPGTPILATFLDAKGTPASLKGIPSFAFPEAAARALARVARYAAWRRRAPGTHVGFNDFDAHNARGIVERAVTAGRTWLQPEEVSALLLAAGLPEVPGRTARSEVEACDAARRLGFPVALKAMGPTIVHKTEVGGVTLGLDDELMVAEAWRDLVQRLGPRLEGVVVQAMAPDGIEMLVGAVQHPIFGPLVACGAGGTFAEILQDTAYRLTPLTDVDATEMMRSLKSAPLLEGYRGRPPADQRALRDALLRLSLLVEACPAIQEVDLNPARSRRIWY